MPRKILSRKGRPASRAFRELRLTIRKYRPWVGYKFYLPEHSRATAEKIILTFVSKLRAAYLADTQSGILHIANRSEAQASQQRTQLTAIEREVESVRAEVMAAGGLRPSLRTHFETAAATLDRGDYPSAKALFDTLLQEIRLPPLRDAELERQIHVKLANFASGHRLSPANKARLSSCHGDSRVFHHSGQSHFVTLCCYHRRRRFFTADAS